MASTQQSIFPWYTFDREEPSVSQYVPANYKGESSYEIPLKETYPIDQDVVDVIKNVVSNMFVETYQLCSFAYSSHDSYTLFVPLTCKQLTRAIEQWNRPGFSFQDRVMRTEAYTVMENIVKQHMVSYRIEPSQLEHRDTTIESLGEIFFVNKEGYINQTDNKIEKFITFKHATVFFCTREI
jgi:hypothetical protein